MRGLDWYEIQLERDDLDPTLRERYEREADRLAAGLTRQQDVLRARRQSELERLAAIRALLESGDVSVVDAYGIEEFGKDYNTDVDRDAHGYPVWHVTSTVARADQPNSWSFTDEEGARRHLRSLIYDRMYTKYVRSCKVDSLGEM